jgi:hypothetical protein
MKLPAELSASIRAGHASQTGAEPLKLLEEDTHQALARLMGGMMGFCFSAFRNPHHCLIVGGEGGILYYYIYKYYYQSVTMM